MPAAQTDAPSSRRLAQAVAGGRGTFVDALVALTRAEIHELDHDDALRRLLTMSIEENVARLLAILADGADPAGAPPSGAMEYARRLGSTPVSLAALLRAYRIGQARFTAHCLEVSAGLDPPIDSTVQIGVVNRISEYLDHVCEQVTLVYQAEHARWLRGQEGLRLEWVRRLLDDAEPVDEPRAEQALGFTLTGPQLAVELWSETGGSDGSLEAAALVMAETCASHHGRLALRRDDRTLWLWLHPGTRQPSWTEALLPPGILVAAGGVGVGLPGFRTSRQQAGQVRRLMSRARHRPRLADWRDVAPIAALAGKPVAARALVLDTLGALAGPDERLVELRDTLRVYLDRHRSHSAAATTLHVHRNTVGYRVEQALRLCAADIDVRPFSVLTALHVDRWCPE